jgi:hypothetical protein
MYRVEWLQSALDELADIWTRSNSIERAAITSASHVLDTYLKGDPHDEGESRAHGRRITFVPPLAVTFRIEEDDQTVTVLQVRAFRQRKK